MENEYKIKLRCEYCIYFKKNTGYCIINKVPVLPTYYCDKFIGGEKNS